MVREQPFHSPARQPDEAGFSMTYPAPQTLRGSDQVGSSVSLMLRKKATGKNVEIVAHRGSIGLSSPPLSSEYGTYKTVKARFWPRLSGKSP